MYMIFRFLVITKIFQVSIVAMVVTMDSAIAVADVLPPVFLLLFLPPTFVSKSEMLYIAILP